jgi:hypothetical protein
VNLKSYHTGANFLDRYRLAGPLPRYDRRTGFERGITSQRNACLGAFHPPARRFSVAFTDFREPFGGASYSNFGESANYEAHFGSVGSRYLLHFYNVLYRVCPGAQQLSQTDKDKALQLLESTRKDVLDPIKGLSDAQWNFKIVPDRWSAAECIEHIAAAEDYIPGDDHRESDGRSGRPQPRRR